MKAYIECIHDEVLKLSTGRYAKMHVIVPQRDGENYQKYHLGECVMQQEGKAHAMKAYIECTEGPGDGTFSVSVREVGRDESGEGVWGLSEVPSWRVRSSSRMMKQDVELPDGVDLRMLSLCCVPRYGKELVKNGIIAIFSDKTHHG